MIYISNSETSFINILINGLTDLILRKPKEQIFIYL
jgi:hypothetical protein